MKRYNYNKTGWWFIIISVVWILLVVIDYKIHLIFQFQDISDLATILAGPSGICASLAGLFFVLENLELQRKTIHQQQVSIDQQKDSIDLQRQELQNQILEMKESNEYFKQQTETFKVQSTESTFFQLLENHRSLISSLTFEETVGYSGLNKYYQAIKSKNTEYYRASKTGNVREIHIGSYYPVRLLKPQVENIEQIYSNIKHLVEFIKQKLDNKLFYHQTLYNTLSKAEKYILGIYCINFQKDAIPLLQSDVFNYLIEFQGSGNSYFDFEQVPFFPELSFSFVQPWYNTSEEGKGRFNKKTKWGHINIKVVNNEPGSNILLKETILEYDFKKNDYRTSTSWDIVFSENANINWNSAIEEHVYDRAFEMHSQSPDVHVHHFIFRIIFVISYNGREFKYTKHCNCQTTVNHRNVDQLFLQ